MWFIVAGWCLACAFMCYKEHAVMRGTLEKEAAEMRKSLAQAMALLNPTGDNLTCGHPIGCLRDDQCGIPEHRYCGYCDALEDAANNWTDACTHLSEEYKDRALTAEKALAGVPCLKCAKLTNINSERHLRAICKDCWDTGHSFAVVNPPTMRPDIAFFNAED